MTVPNPQRVLRPGRDPNDGTWVLARYPRDWSGAALWDTAITSLGSIELAPTAFDNDGQLHALHCATSAAGNLYCGDPRNSVIRVTGPCDSEPSIVSGLGGLGSQTGQFRRPRGLTLAKGLLYIADSGNHRVQIAALTAAGRCAHVISTLGATNEWGAPVPGTADGAMTEPFDVAVDENTGRIFVADREAGLIQIWNANHRFICQVRVDGEPLDDIEPPTARPIAIEVGADGALWILDAGGVHSARLSPDGELLGSADVRAEDSPYRDLDLDFRYQPLGELIVRLDSGQLDSTWDRVWLDAELPAGTSVTVQSFADNDPYTLSPIDALAGRLPWAPHAPVALTADEADADRDVEGELGRLVLSDTEGWRRSVLGWRRRVVPQVATFVGNGPNASAVVAFEWSDARALRIGDTIEFRREDGLTQSTAIQSIPNPQFRATVRGDAVFFGPGSHAVLRQKSGASLLGTERTLRVLSLVESIDLTGADPSTQFAAAMPHSVAAFLDSGDQFVLRQGTDEAIVDIDCFDVGPVDVAVAPVLAADFSSSVATLTENPGRLFVDRSEGFDKGISVDTEIDIRNESADEVATVTWASDGDSSDLALWLSPGSLGPFVTEADWTELAFSPQPSDRGQHLWLRLILRGPSHDADPLVASASPRIKAIRASLPRHSFLRYLPATFSRRDSSLDPSGALFLERFLSLFEERLTEFEAAYESVSRLLNPEAATPEWLRFVASWLGIVFDPSWPIERRRQLVLEANELFTRRGTVESVRRYVEIYTGHRPSIVEGFTVRPATIFELGCVTPLGCVALGCSHSEDTNVSELACAHAHRFTIHAYLGDECDLLAAESALHSILRSVIPAHTSYELNLVTSDMRVGIDTQVGVGTLLAHPQGIKSLLGVSDERSATVLGDGPPLAADAASFSNISGENAGTTSSPPSTIPNRVGSNVRIDNDFFLR